MGVYFTPMIPHYDFDVKVGGWRVETMKMPEWLKLNYNREDIFELAIDVKLFPKEFEFHSIIEDEYFIESVYYWAKDVLEHDRVKVYDDNILYLTYVYTG